MTEQDKEILRNTGISLLAGVILVLILVTIFN